jgi:uncharacterized protein YbcC (UPF0753/DUF2309 family)
MMTHTPSTPKASLPERVDSDREISPEISAEIRGLDATIEQACERIAPLWPLDRFIAVNPLWPRIDQPIATAAAELAAQSGAQLLMPREWFREQLRAGHLTVEHLRAAIDLEGASITVEALEASLASATPTTARRARVMDVVPPARPDAGGPSWREFVVHGTSQFCAAYFDEAQAELAPDREGGLYAAWRRHAATDRTPALRMGVRGDRTVVGELPSSARAMIELGLRELEIPEHERAVYLEGLLLDLLGWASWCSGRRWVARLHGGDDAAIVDLLAIRVAWELVLLRTATPSCVGRWRLAMAAWPAIDAAARAARADDWLLQRALESAHHEAIARRLPAGLATACPTDATAQAVFCIDVRSEVIRRALEREAPSVQTLGFAGFFGLPIEYLPVGAGTGRPQLPGLLGPRMRVTDATTDDGLAARRAARLRDDAIWKRVRTSPSSSFGFVDAQGIVVLGALLGDAFGRGPRPAARPERAGLSADEDARRKPRLTAHVDGTPLATEERCRLAEGILRGMGLVRDFAPLVVLVGHGSETRNNPHAAGLDCGACCGQTGEVNARAAAALLNEPEVRVGLRAAGLDVPDATHFVAALHNTTTDELRVFDGDTVPPSHRRALEALQRQLDAATIRARRERAPRFGLGGLDDASLAVALLDRARDWAQVRPEWGLADNAAFLVAPREHVRHLDLGGRAFLHDYRAEDDDGFAILEAIMTAPMLVTHWINLQYYASTVDNERYGSGDKVLHNVVGGHIGVFEGNGGDLRIGLPRQSVHDGSRWVHTPLRLGVFIEAPRPAIEAVLTKHATVRALVEHGWIHLFQIDVDERQVHRYHRGWIPAGDAAA